MQIRQGIPGEAGVSPERIQRVTTMMRDWVSNDLLPAVSVLVARRGVIFLQEAFGTLGPDPASPPVNRDTIFGIASIAKTIAATAIMLLVEEGLVGLNRKVQEYIPEFEGKGKEDVLVSHLLTHTSGMSDEEVKALEDRVGGTVDFPPLEPTEHVGMRERLHMCFHAPLAKPPGTEFAYSNAAYDVLGEIVRRVSGLSFDTFTRERIFLPLGMNDTYYSVPDELRDRIVKYHISQFDWDIIESPCAEGCAFSTAMDMAIFGQTFLNGGSYGNVRLLSPVTVNAMIHNQTQGIPGLLGSGEIAPPWGLGWILFAGARLRNIPSLWSSQAYGHTGGSGTALWIDPAYETVGVILCDFVRWKDVAWPGDLLIDAIIASIIDL